MTNVLILKNWDYKINLLRQTPDSSGVWGNIKFETSLTYETDSFDYLIILNRLRNSTSVLCKNIWAIIQEPPNEVFKPLHRGQSEFDRVYCQDMSLNTPRHFHSPPALPWFINKTFDQLVCESPPLKHKNLSLMCSTNGWFRGHRNRLTFIENLKKYIDVDHYGYGFNYINDKWDALAPYKYSIVIENFTGPYYWSEKLSDCFLSYTLPIYIGCTNIYDYFPEESLIYIDINSESPQTVAEKILDAISSRQWEQRIEFINAARRKILYEYQLFPFLSNQINQHISSLEHQAIRNRHISHLSLASVEMLARSKSSIFLLNIGSKVN